MCVCDEYTLPYLSIPYSVDVASSKLVMSRLGNVIMLDWDCIL